MDQNQSDIQSRILEIFFPYLREKIQKFKSDDTLRFVHYTNAEAAVSILKNKEIWMRNASTMNDYSEIRYGYERLVRVFQSEHGNRFQENLDSLFPDIFDRLTKAVTEWSLGIVKDTYLTCVSEHFAQENTYGRLSMWRAYGKSTGIAFVLNTNIFFSESQVLNVFSSPVAYLNDKEFIERFLEINEAINSSKVFLKQLGDGAVFHLLLSMCLFAVLCTKHKGFVEEQEWRIINSSILKQMLQNNSITACLSQERIKSDVVVIGGIPQTIYKIPLENVPEKGLVGLTLPEVLDRIIIGPTGYPRAIFDAFCRLLEAANVPDPESKIIISDIPIR